MTPAYSSPDRDSGPQCTVTAELLSVVFESRDTGFTVARFKGPPPDTFFTGTGEMLQPSVGETYTLVGSWVTHPRFGRQFSWSSYELPEPTTEEGLVRFLSSPSVKGLGRTLASRIVARFGRDTLRVMDESIEDLLSIEGIGPATLERIRESWLESRRLQSIMAFLRECGVSTSYAHRFYRSYGDHAVSLLRSDPYRVVEEIDGVGFLTADRMGQALGILPTDPGRLRAAVLDGMNRLCYAEGHVYVPRDGVQAECASFTGVDPEECGSVLDGMVEDELLFADEDALTLPELRYAETVVRDALVRLASFPPEVSQVSHINEALKNVERERDLRFAPLQAEAVIKAFTGRMLVVTGGPGTGKTTMVAGICAIAPMLGLRLALCAPTGRAAKRLSQLTGVEARTIHRLLEYDPFSGAFLRHGENPVDADLVVVDEMSMVDLPLMSRILGALGPDTRLVCVGDADQLPAIGPGNILGDMIASGVLDVVELNRIYRQSGGSSIIANAHRIRAGQEPVEDEETWFIECDTAEQIADRIRNLVQFDLPSRFGYDPMTDIQVVSPMHKTPAGVRALNTLLQSALNPDADLVVDEGDRRLRIGDKVMQIRNDYQKNVFNGDIGRIVAYDDRKGEMRIRFDEEIVTYAPEEFGDLILAYAGTVHKCQGSEYDAVIVVLSTQHRILLSRNLLYTAITRAKRVLVLVGQRRACALALANARPSARMTLLASRLADALR